MTTRTTLTVAALGLAIVAIVVAVIVRPAAEPDQLERARQMLEQMYEQGDAEPVFERVEPATLPRDPQGHDQLVEALESVFATQDFEVTEEELITVRGHDVARIRVGQINWCVTQDGRILLGCRVALASVEGTTDLPDIDLSQAELDILVNRVDVATVLTPEGESEVELSGPPQLDSEFARQWRLVEVDYVMEGHRLRAPLEDFTLRPGVGMLFLFEISEAADVATVGQATFRFVWAEGEVVVTVDEIIWLVG